MNTASTAVEFRQSNNGMSSSKQILVVEDDDALRKLLLLTLKLDGYQVITANDGREALTVFGQNNFDCVLLDVNMPFVDGMEVCTELRKQTDVPIIMITAN
jgi:DNA-binding response OmpR family regulator